MLGKADLDVKWLEIANNGKQVTYHQMITVRIYKPLPDGWTGPSKGVTINADFAPLSLTVPPGQWLTIVPESKMPDSAIILELHG